MAINEDIKFDAALDAAIDAAPAVASQKHQSIGNAILLVLVAIAVAAPFILQGFIVFQITMVFVYAIAIMGLNLLTGFNGQFSLGHSAFFAIGAYTAAILMD